MRQMPVGTRRDMGQGHAEGVFGRDRRGQEGDACGDTGTETLRQQRQRWRPPWAGSHAAVSRACWAQSPRAVLGPTCAETPGAASSQQASEGSQASSSSLDLPPPQRQTWEGGLGPGTS